MPNLLNPYFSSLRPPTTPPYSPTVNITARDPNNNGILPANGALIDPISSTIGSDTFDQVSGAGVKMLYNEINGFPVLDGNGLYESTSNLAGTIGNDYTFFMYFKALTSSGGAAGYAAPSGAFPTRLANFFFNGSFYLDHGNVIASQRLIALAPTDPVTNYSVYGGRSSATNLKLWQDGVTIGSNSSGGFVTVAGQKASVFDINATLKCAQIVIYNYPVDDAKVGDIFTYFTDEWA